MTSRDGATVEDRLRRALDAPLVVPTTAVDMSPAAVTARLVDALELSRLCSALGEPRVSQLT